MTRAPAYVVNGTMSSMSTDCVPALQVHWYIECIGMCNGIFIEFSSIYSLTCRPVVVVDCHTLSCHPACLILVCHLSYSIYPDQGSLPALPPSSPNTASLLNLLVHHISIYDHASPIPLQDILLSGIREVETELVTTYANFTQLCQCTSMRRWCPALGFSTVWQGLAAMICL